MTSILSTKKLLPDQKKLFLNTGITLIETDFIKTIPVSFDMIDIKKKLVFTSQNTVLAIINHPNFKQIINKPCFCVGLKTKQLLEQNGFRILESTNYASDLIEIIKNRYSKEQFTFFSGNLRLDTIPLGMQEANILFNEITVYNTLFTPKKIEQSVNGILFFSPSGIQSYTLLNAIDQQICFCIGTTTSGFLISQKEKDKKQIKTNNSKPFVILADEQTVESVIKKSITYFNTPHHDNKK